MHPRELEGEDTHTPLIPFSFKPKNSQEPGTDSSVKSFDLPPAGGWHSKQPTHAQVPGLDTFPHFCLLPLPLTTVQSQGKGQIWRPPWGGGKLGHLSQINALFAGLWRTRGPEWVSGEELREGFRELEEVGCVSPEWVLPYTALLLA